MTASRAAGRSRLTSDIDLLIIICIILDVSREGVKKIKN